MPQHTHLHASLAHLLRTNAAPVLVTLGLTGAIGIADIYMAGIIGKSAQAAVGIADQFLFFAVLLATGLSAGTSACISRATGAHQILLARAYARDSIILATIFGGIAAFIGYVFAGQIFGFFTSDEEAARNGIPYLQLCALANLPWAIAQTQTAILRASGKAKSCVLLWMVIALISIFGAAPFFFLPTILQPSLSVLAIAWIVGASAGVILGFALLARSVSSRHPARRNNAMHMLSSFPNLPKSDLPNQRNFLAGCRLSAPARFNRQKSTFRTRAAHLLQVSVPVSVGELCWLVASFMTYKLLGSLPGGSELQAAWSIKFKIEEFVAIAPLLSVSLTAAAAVGTRLGADDRTGARQAARQLAAFATMLMLLAGLLLCLFAHPLACLFAQDASVVHATEWMLGLSPLVLPVMALSLVLFAGLEGAGCAKIPMAITVIVLLALRLPISWYLGLNLGHGLEGVWFAATLSHIILAGAAIVCFRQPGWDLPGLFGEVVAMKPLIVIASSLEHDGSGIFLRDHATMQRRRRIHACLARSRQEN